MEDTDWAAVDGNPLEFLVAPYGYQKFMDEVWEQKPQVFKATVVRKALFQNLMTFKHLQKYATAKEEAGDPLMFGADINAARYEEGVRDTPNGEVADTGTLKDLFAREGCTMQVHQPQRFVDELWRLMAALERQLGCLVGANAYLTPKHTQGLAPHHDDVEIFVVQAEGAKRWTIYPSGAPGAPQGGRHILANHCSGDLWEPDLGPPLMEFILEVGDVLYMPRGTIHQARALSTHSSHLTISTYQRWAWGDLLQYTASVALANPVLQTRLPRALRSGLPPGWLGAATFCAADVPAGAAAAAAAGAGKKAKGKAKGKGGAKGGKAAAVEAAEGAGSAAERPRAQLLLQLAGAFRSMADWLEGEREGEGEESVLPGERALLAAGDVMAEDFMRNRLPPYPDQLPDPGPEPSQDSRVACRGAGIFRLVALSEDDCPEDGSESESEPESEEEEQEGGAAAVGPQWVRLMSCLENSREMHMLAGGRGEKDEDEDEAGCCGVPGCHEDHDHDHGHDHRHGHDCGHGHDHGHGSEEEEEAAAGQGAVAAVGGGQKTGGQKRKREGEEGASEGSAEDLVDLSGSDLEEVDIDALLEEGGPQQEDAVFPIQFAPALLQLLGTSVASGGVRVADLPLPGGEELRLDVAGVLWRGGVLVTLPPGAAETAEAAAAEAAGAEGGKVKEEGGRHESGSGGSKKKGGDSGGGSKKERGRGGSSKKVKA